MAWGFGITKESPFSSEDSMAEGFVTQERICLDAARSKVVDCDSPEAAFQLATPGKTVSAADAEKYGLKPPEKPQSVRAANGEGEQTPEPEAGAEKALSASEDKSRKGAQNKGN